MKRQLRNVIAAILILVSGKAIAQGGKIETLFQRSAKSTTGYGAITNKFTQLRGEYANIVGLYGGVYLDRRVMLGLSLEANTNNIPVPLEHSVDPRRSLSYQYGQFGMMTEYVVASNKPVHLVFSLFAGAGFTLQYERYGWEHNFDFEDGIHDENWFFVAEPGVQLELNLFKWMRFSPGISYRTSFGSDGKGMQDKDVRGISYNATLKFGRF